MLNKKNKLLSYLTLSFAWVLCLLFASGCNKTQDLSAYLSELQCNVYYGSDANYNIKAVYGFNETPLKNDGQKGKTTFTLTFMLFTDLTDQSEYQLAFTSGENEYKQTFAPDGVRSALTAKIAIDNFTLNQFDVNICHAEKTTKITLKSALPQGTIDYKQALSAVYNHQESFIKNYYDQQGNFTAEIRQRIIVRDGKPYWYVGFINNTGGIKALLVDGLNGQILAVREVF